MVIEPTRRDDIEESVETRLRDRITKLTNFVGTSFNKLFLRTFADELYEIEVRLLAAQLSGWVDYAGGPITQDDLDDLGLEEFDDLETLNSYMLDEHLDYLGALVGTSRDTGSRASVTVEIDVFDASTRVPDGMRVATPPDFDGTQYVFTVDLDDEDAITPADQGNQTTVVVDALAESVGDEYNVGSNTITRLRSPPPGVEGVTNPQSASGGENPESNDSLRARIKNSVFETSGGGTTEGIRGFVLNETEASDVFVDEFYDAVPSYVDVVVDGGVTDAVRDAIETSRPAGVRHNLVRPASYTMAVSVVLDGTDVSGVEVKDSIEEYIFDLGLGDPFVRDKLIQAVMNTDADIDDIRTINARIVGTFDNTKTYESGTDQYTISGDRLGRIENESYVYRDGTQVYELDVVPVESGSVSIEATIDGIEQTVSDTEWSLVDSDGDGMLDSIDWSTGTDVPDSDSIWSVSYDTKRSASETITFDETQDQYDLTYIPALGEDSTASDGSTTYEYGVDYDIVDTDDDGQLDTIDWSIGGDSPADGASVTVDYEIDVGSINSVVGRNPDGTETDFTEGVDFNEADTTGDGYSDSIDWSIGGAAPNDNQQFNIDASIQSSIDENYHVSPREKIEPIVDEIEVTVYE